LNKLGFKNKPTLAHGNIEGDKHEEEFNGGLSLPTINDTVLPVGVTECFTTWFRHAVHHVV